MLRPNDELWRKGDFVRDYATRTLAPAEVVVLARYRELLAGSVLELGCGAGRVTGYLLELGADVLGTDISPAMIAYCRQTYPTGRFELRDLRVLDDIEPESFDAIVAANNLLDILEHEERTRTLGEIARILRPGGLLVMSSHNRAYARRIPSPLEAVRGAGKVEALRRLARVPLWLRNRRSLAAYVHEERDYALLNDEAHDYRLVHYYIERDTQERQLADAGLTLVESLDGEGRPVETGARAPESSSLHYVARR